MYLLLIELCCFVQISVLVLHLICHCLTVVEVSFGSLIKGITPKISICFVLINTIK